MEDQLMTESYKEVRILQTVLRINTVYSIFFGVTTQLKSESPLIGLRFSVSYKQVKGFSGKDISTLLSLYHHRTKQKNANSCDDEQYLNPVFRGLTLQEPCSLND
jgi:hypothetical protein